MDANMQFTMNSFRQLFPDKIFSLTAVKFPDISRFSRQVVTLKKRQQTNEQTDTE